MNTDTLTMLQKKRIELEILESLTDRINRDIKEIGFMYDFEKHDYVADPEYKESDEDQYRKWYLRIIKEDLEAKI